MTKEAEIRQLLIQGTTKADLARQGYARGTVYKVGRRLANETSLSPLSSKTNATEPRIDSMLVPVDRLADQEIAQLQRDIQKARLESDRALDLGQVKSLKQVQRELSCLQEWAVAMVCSLGEGIQQLAGNKVDASAFEAFERDSLRKLREIKF